MKKLAKLHSFLLSKELSTQLKLENQHYVVLIPKKFVSCSDPTFDLVLENNRISLLGPTTERVPEVNQSAVVIDT